MNSPKILDLGCGTRKRPGAIGLDINPATGADIIHDLGVFPYPFTDNSFKEIYVDNVMEHLENVIKTMEELHRISKPNAMVKIIVPYFKSRWAFIDPTHRHFFTIGSFSYFDPESMISKIYPYSQARFSPQKIIFNETIKRGWFMTIIKKIANRWPDAYERMLSNFFPLDDITFYLKVIK